MVTIQTMKNFLLPLFCTVALITGCTTTGRAGKSSVSLFDGTSLNGWTQIPPDSWAATNGVMASLGVGRGVIYTANDYTRYRLTFTMRHLSGNKDHQACVLIFCT